MRKKINLLIILVPLLFMMLPSSTTTAAAEPLKITFVSLVDTHDGNLPRSDTEYRVDFYGSGPGGDFILWEPGDYYAGAIHWDWWIYFMYRSIGGNWFIGKFVFKVFFDARDLRITYEFNDWEFTFLFDFNVPQCWGGYCLMP